MYKLPEEGGQASFCECGICAREEDDNGNGGDGDNKLSDHLWGYRGHLGYQIMRWRISQTWTADAERGPDSCGLFRIGDQSVDGTHDTLVVSLGVFVVLRLAEAGEILGMGGILGVVACDEGLPGLRTEFLCRSEARFLSIRMFRVGTAEEDDGRFENRLSSAFEPLVSFYAATCSEETVRRQATQLMLRVRSLPLALRWL